MPNYDNLSQFLTVAGNSASTNGQVVIGANVALTGASSYAIGNNSAVANGFILQNSGVTMNYGVANANTTGTVVTFAHPYTNAVFTIGADSNTVLSSIGITASNTTTITITSNTTTNVAVFWQAWGI